MHNMTIWLQQLSSNRTRVRGAFYAQETIMMHARPIRPHEIASLRWQSRSMSVA